MQNSSTVLRTCRRATIRSLAQLLGGNEHIWPDVRRIAGYQPLYEAHVGVRFPLKPPRGQYNTYYRALKTLFVF